MSNIFGPGSGGGGGSGIAQIVSLAEDQQCNGYKVTELGTPINPTDAATKAYVDAAVGGGGGSATLAAVLTQGNDAEGQDIEGVGTIICQEINSGTNPTLSIRDTIDLGGVYKIQNSANATASGDLVNLNTLTSTLGSYVQSTATGSIQMNGFNITNAAVVASAKFKAADGINQSQIWFTGGAPLSNSLLKIGPADQSSYAIQCDTDSGQTDIVQVNTDTISNITGSPVDVVGGMKIDVIYDKNNSPGSSGNVLTAGAGGELVWQSGGGSGGIDGIVAGDGILVNANNPSLPIVSTSAVKIITAGSGISLSGDNSNLTISATSPGGVTSLSVANNSMTIQNPTTTPSLRPNCIATAFYAFDAVFANSQIILPIPVNPGGSSTCWFFPEGTAVTGSAFNILNNWTTQNYVCVISVNPTVTMSGPLAAPDYLSANLITDVGGVAGGSDGVYFYGITANTTCNFNIVTSTNALANAGNTHIGLRITNNTQNAVFNWALIPGTLRIDVYDIQQI